MAHTKYILIDCGEEYSPVAVSREVLSDMLRRGTPLLSYRPISLVDIRRGNIPLYSDEDYFTYVSFEDFKRRVEGKLLTGRVLWFNREKGLGSVDVAGEGLYPLYACNISGKRTWYSETACVYLLSGTLIEVEIMPFIKESLVVCHSPGIFDAEKWERLDAKGLALKCGPDDKLSSGLFA